MIDPSESLGFSNDQGRKKIQDTQMKTTPPKSLRSALASVFALLFAVTLTASAAPPDLTSGGVPNEDPAITFNLGPTGLRGWAYHVKIETGEGRQILVTEVASGSPASGAVAVGDVILGASGTAASPVNFSSDARKSLALAIVRLKIVWQSEMSKNPSGRSEP